MRDGSRLLAELLYKARIFRNSAHRSRIQVANLGLHDRNINAESGEQLAHAVMQFARNLPPLFVPDLLQTAGKFPEVGICRLQISRAFLNLAFKLVMRLL